MEKVKEMAYQMFHYELSVYWLEWRHNKEARSSNDEDLGEIEEVDENYIFVQRGIISKDKFYILMNMVESFGGNVLRVSISEEYATAMFLKLD